MGWRDYLHMFLLPAKNNPRQAIRLEAPYIQDLEEEPVFTTEAAIKSYFQKAGDKCVYIYDFGDSWQRELILEAILQREHGKKILSVLRVKWPVLLKTVAGFPGT
jgi:hypothetical protein